MPAGSAGWHRCRATDGFSAYIATPAITALQRQHPNLSVEIRTVTRRAMQHRSGLDIEVVGGDPQVHRVEAVKLGEYMLDMYAAQDCLAQFGTPADAAELVAHPLVYFVNSMLQVDDLDAPRRLVPTMRDSISSTNVFVHVEATRTGSGIGFLPCFIADRQADLVRLLPNEFAEQLPYGMVLRSESLRQGGVSAGRPAAIHRVAGTGDHGVLPRDEPEDEGCDLLRLHESLLHQWGAQIARRHAGAGNAVRSPLQCGDLRQPLEPVLGADLGPCEGGGADAVHR